MQLGKTERENGHPNGHPKLAKLIKRFKTSAFVTQASLTLNQLVVGSIPTRGTCFLFFFVPLNTLLTLNHLWLKLYNPPVILMFLVGTILKLGLKHILFLCG